MSVEAYSDNAVALSKTFDGNTADLVSKNFEMIQGKRTIDQNRKTGLKMYRVWIQGRFYKPPLNEYFAQKLAAQMEKEALFEKEQQLLQQSEEKQEIIEEVKQEI